LNSRPRRILGWASALIAALSCACTVSGFDANVKASSVDEGATEAQLLSTAGLPTRRIEPPSPDCAKAGGSHEVVYDVTIRYLGGWLGEDPSSLVSFCIGPMSRIIEKRDIVF
jgi:hypothetical protein